MAARTTNMAATQLLIAPDLKADGQALAIVRQTSTADVWRTCVEAHLPTVMSKYSSVLEELYGALARMGIVGQLEKEAALQAMIDQKIRFADLFLPDGSARADFPGKLPGK